MKIKKSILRRIKITGNGKILHMSNFKRHLSRNKSSAQKRRLAGYKPFKQQRTATIKKALGL